MCDLDEGNQKEALGWRKADLGGIPGLEDLVRRLLDQRSRHKGLSGSGTGTRSLNSSRGCPRKGGSRLR